MADIVRTRYVYTWYSQGQFARIWEWSDISCFLKIVKIPRIRYYLFDFLILDVSSALNPPQSLRDLTPIRSYVHSMFFESHASFPRQTVENIVRFLFLFLIKVSFITKNKVDGDPIIIFIYPLRLLRAIRVNGENRCGQFGTKVVTEWRIGGAVVLPRGDCLARDYPVDRIGCRCRWTSSGSQVNSQPFQHVGLGLSRTGIFDARYLETVSPWNGPASGKVRRDCDLVCVSFLRCEKYSYRVKVFRRV